MKDYPVWVLLLNGVLLIPLLCCPFFLFGGAHLFVSDKMAWRAVDFLLVQLDWLISVIALFKSLSLYDKGWRRQSILLTSFSIVFVVSYTVWIFN